MYVTSIVDQNTRNLQRESMLYLFNPDGTPPRISDTSYHRVLIREVPNDSINPNIIGYQTLIGFNKVTSLIQNVPRPRTYHTFNIPKKSGGFRTIKAPSPELKEAQAEGLKYLLYQDHHEYPLVHPHDCAYAYIKNRSTLHALKKHQENDSRWFLKLDLKDFFPSCTRDWLTQTLLSIHPVRSTPSPLFDSLVDLFLDENALPQGAPSSPALSNLCMLPIDKALAHELYSKGFIYTRYADDLLISHRYDFNFHDTVKMIEQILEPTPFQLNHSKTRYGSRAGQNWNLGLMLNKENKITIGHKRKERLRVTLYRFMSDPETWTLEERQHLAGTLSYFEQIEPEYKRQMIDKYERKFNVCLKDLL